MLNWLKKRWRRFRYVIHIDGDPYMVRYRLVSWPDWLRRRGFRNVYLHHILRSDRDREFHDHPWFFKSLILWGGYWEWRPECTVSREFYGPGPQKYWFGPFSSAIHRAEDMHRVELKPGRTAWTLVFVGPAVRNWGFLLRDGTWLAQEEFHKLKGYDTDGKQLRSA